MVSNTQKGGFIYLISGELSKELSSHYRIPKPIYSDEDSVFVAKIGFADNVHTRFSSNQTSCFINLSLMAFKMVSDKKATEKELHSRYSMNRIRGEWFKFNRDELLKVEYEVNSL